MPTHHVLDASPETVHWGYFDAELAPVLEVESGDTVTLRSVSGTPRNLPGPGFHVPPELLEIHKSVQPKLPGHIVTGPVAVKGAKPGQVLQVDIIDVKPRQDWGYNYSAPLKGGLPDDVTETHQIIIKVDSEAWEAELPWGLRLPLAPFFGVMGTGPRPEWGMVSTIQPRANGGNLDNKELVAGTTLFLPVFVEGALFSAGDGHGRQGDGEVNVTAIEMALEGQFRLTARDDMELDAPMAETPTHYLTMAFHEDLDIAARDALRRMIGVITSRTNLSWGDAYALCSLACDLRVTQIVNGNKGVHAMLKKEWV